MPESPKTPLSNGGNLFATMRGDDVCLWATSQQGNGIAHTVADKTHIERFLSETLEWVTGMRVMLVGADWPELHEGEPDA